MSEACSSLQEIVGHVLIVDDEALNRQLLNGILKSKGHETSQAENGKQALEIIHSCSVDVVLLDVVMPGFDGFQVCRRLKADPRTASIPVILVTSLSDRSHRLMGIEVGARDFLSKPVDAQEVLLRVRNAIQTRFMYENLQDSYQKLKELETLRDKLTHMLVHDMRSPLAGIHGYLEMIRHHGRINQDPKMLRYANQALTSTSSLIEMLNTILDVSRLEEGKMPLYPTPVNLADIARQVIDSFLITGKTSAIVLECPHQPVHVVCDADIIRRVITNLVSNALKYSGKNARIIIEIETKPEGVEVRVSDNGPGIKEEYLQVIFEKYGRALSKKEYRSHSTGLGLAFCKLAIEAHNGRICVQTEVNKGSTFWFTLPQG